MTECRRFFPTSIMGQHALWPCKCRCHLLFSQQAHTRSLRFVLDMSGTNGQRAALGAGQYSALLVRGMQRLRLR